MSTTNVPKHHIDRRADALVAANTGSDDELLSTVTVAHWLGLSTQWLEIGRSKNYGPKFQRLSPRRVRYRRGDVLAWLRSRTFSSTSEYADADRRFKQQPAASSLSP